jgi:hypothetical protein
MKKLAAILVLSISFAASAQLFVKNGGYMYVGDQYLYVKQDVNLQNNGNMYLRNGGQLIQGTAGTSTNQGQGALSVFQEGNVDNFEYNYWCSPVGNASAALGNENFGITMLNRPSSVTASSAATMLSMSALDGTTTNTSLNIAPRWIFKFLSSDQYSQWVQAGSATSIGPGEGFTMKGTSGTDASFAENGVTNNPGAAQRYDFRGKPNDGNITVNVAAGKMTLTGNPYPSSLDLRSWLLSQANCTGVAYFWEQDKNVNSHYITAYQGGYGTYAAGSNTYVAPVFWGYDGSGTQLGVVGSGTNYPRQYSPVAQGFMIEGAANGTVTLSNAYRVFKKEGVDTAFSRPAPLAGSASVSGDDAAPQIRLNIQINDNSVRQLALTFSPLATDGVDRGWDAKSPGGGTSDGFFSLDGKEYVIAAVNFDINERIPLGFKCSEQQTFRITVGDMLNFADAPHIYLHNKIDGSYHEILGEVCQLTLPAGTDTSTYEVTFTNDMLGVPSLSDSSLDIVQDNQAQQLAVSNPDMIEMRSIALYDMTGKQVLYKSDLGNAPVYRISTLGLAEGIYIVQILTPQNQSFSRKISVFRKG